MELNRNLCNGLMRKMSYAFSNQTLVNCYYLANFYCGRREKTRALAFFSVERVSVLFPFGVWVGSDGNCDNIILGFVEPRRGDYNRRAVLYRSEVGERKGDKNDISRFISRCSGHRMDCSRIQMTALPFSGTTTHPVQCVTHEAKTQGSAFVLPALLSGVSFRLFLEKDLKP